MKIKLSKEALASLPDADSQGIVRVTAALRLTGDDGSAELMEVNDSPVGKEPNDDDSPMKPEELPNLDNAQDQINDPTTAAAPSLY